MGGAGRTQTPNKENTKGEKTSSCVLGWSLDTRLLKEQDGLRVVHARQPHRRLGLQRAVDCNPSAGDLAGLAVEYCKNT